MNFPLEPTTAVTFIAGGVLIIHLSYLLITNHASLSPMGTSPTTKCGDKRETTRGSTIFGGASAFDFGLAYGLAGIFLPLPYWLAVLLIGYANMRFWASIIQTLNFAIQSAKAELGQYDKEFYIKAHLDGCGYTTAASPLWILFWIQKIPGFGWVVAIRDVITAIDFVFSLPGIGLLNVWTLLIRRRRTIPMLAHVDLGH
jgi:hypothetical protein